MIVGHDLRIVEITPEAAAWCGGTAAELDGVNANERCPTPPPFDEAIEAALKMGSPATLEYESLIVPGRWVQVDIEPLEVGARVCFRDISARVLAEQSVRARDGRAAKMPVR